MFLTPSPFWPWQPPVLD